MLFYSLYQISRAPGILGFLGNIGQQGHDAIFNIWGTVRAQGSHEKTSASWFACLHWIKLP